MTSPDFWVILRTLASNSDSAPAVFEILESGVSGTPSAIIADNYEAAIGLLNEFASMASIGAIEEQRADSTAKKSGRKPVRPVKQDKKPSENAVVARGIKAIQIITQMTERIPHLMKQSHLESNEAWSAYWLPIFKSLTTQCTNPCREVRHLAFASMQRSLLSPELTSEDHSEWTAIFGEVLFPLILVLLKPEVFSSDRDGMSETRVQAASLLSKVFLQYLVMLSQWDGMLDLWLKIIEIMDRLMNSGQGDSLVSPPPICALQSYPYKGKFRKANHSACVIGGGCTGEPEKCAAYHVQQRLSCTTKQEPGAQGAMGRDVEEDR